jgi:hypothetical protein
MANPRRQTDCIGGALRDMPVAKALNARIASP